MTKKVGSSGEDTAVVQINNYTDDANMEKELDTVHEIVINEQAHIENNKISYWKLYSHATKKDWILMIFGLICATISGIIVVSICFFFKLSKFKKKIYNFL